MVRILVIGASGMLGKDVVSHFSAIKQYQIFAIQRNIGTVAFSKNVITENIDALDKNIFGAFLKKIDPHIIINCAALVDVDFCEIHPKLANEVNSEIIKIIYEYASDSKLVQVSTDSVFDGINGNYTEEDKVNPLNYYAKSKLNGELVALNLFQNCIVIRTNIYGFHMDDSKTSLAEWAINSLTSNKSISGFDDVYFNPVYTKQLASIIELLINVDFSGIINVGSNRYVSKYDFLNELKKAFNLEPVINKKSIKELQFQAKRPNNTTLNIDRLHKVIDSIPTLTEGLKMFYRDYEELKRIQK